MPLTFAHPAIVLPLNYLPKRSVSLTALIAGSVAPDFEYFFRMKVLSIYSHTWAGMFWFDLPVSIALAFVYHNVVRRQLIANMPSAINRRISGFSNFNWNGYFLKNWLEVIISAIIGIASHLFWDSFTHITGYFVELWGMAAQVTVFSIRLPLYKIIQHLSTLVGCLAIAFAVYNMPSRRRTNNESIWPYWAMMISAVLATITLRILFGLTIHQYGDILVTAISGALLGVVLVPMFYKSY